MSLTAEQKTSVKFYLGCPQTNSSGSYVLNSILEGINDASVETLITNCLTELADVDSKLTNFARGIAGITAVGTGDPEFEKGQALKDLRSEGQVWVARLSFLLDYPPCSDVYSPGGVRASSPIACFG